MFKKINFVFRRIAGIKSGLHNATLTLSDESFVGLRELSKELI